MPAYESKFIKGFDYIHHAKLASFIAHCLDRRRFSQFSSLSSYTRYRAYSQLLYEVLKIKEKESEKRGESERCKIDDEAFNFFLLRYKSFVRWYVTRTYRNMLLLSYCTASVSGCKTYHLSDRPFTSSFFM